MLPNFILLPLIAALIGWITNYVAVKMIFRPRKPFWILGFNIQGVVPKRQKELALSIAETIEAKLITHGDVTSIIHSPRMEAEVAKAIEAEIDIFLTSKLGSIPMVGMFLQGDIVRQIKQLLVEQLKGSIPSLLERMVGHIESELDFKTLVQNRIESFDLATLEDIVYRISAKELRFIEILGGILGFLVGLVQLGLVVLNQ